MIMFSKGDFDDAADGMDIWMIPGVAVVDAEPELFAIVSYTE
ncbi:MAG: hypothetical protein VCD00_13455 [Candidatus Hydrogenedentota bacterium]